ncbi:MAG: T9SS type A sorting domain-containing protein [Bacteroidetes bacterium]|nr:T9SS type A sorting domain-containing protein [Bacteroidota bacterium]
MKIKLLFVSISVCIALSATAQITINRSDIGTLIGVDIIQANDTINLDLLSPGNAGVNQTWDLTGIGNNYPDTMSFFSPSESPCASDFPTANVAGKQGDMFFYMHDDNTKFELIGSCGVIMGQDTSIIPFTPPQIQLTFPSTYNTVFTGQTKEIIKFPYPTPPPDSLKIHATISYSSIMDGWGTITTPTGTYNALRQKLTTYETDSIFVYTTASGWQLNGAPIKDTTIEYGWLSQDNPFIATIKVDAQGNVKNANYLLSSNVGVNEIQNISNTINIFPNPSNGKFNLEVLGNKGQITNLEIYNVLGELIYSSPIQKQQTSNEIDISNSPKGIYFVKIYNGEKVYSKKIVIQ